MDAFSRAYTLGQAAPYKAKMKKNVENAYNLRFAKTDGLDTWIAATIAKPFMNPATPVTPISDPEPATTSTTPPVTTPVANPIKPAAKADKPVTKPQSVMGTVAKKKIA
jgi:hypothetical protein